MKIFTLNEGDLYFGGHKSGDTIGDKFDAQDFLDIKLDQFFRSRPEYKEYIDLYGKIHALDKYALLIAHAEQKNNWVYFDEGEKYSVQSWINKVDGQYSALLLCVCNPRTITPRSETSILVVPDSDIDFTARFTGQYPIFSLLVPGIGYIDSYTIRYELQKLK